MHVCVGHLDFSYVNCNEKLNLVYPLVMGTRTLTSYFVISRYLDYIQNYITQLEQCGHIVVKGLATVTWLDGDQINVCLVTWLDYSFAYNKLLSSSHFHLCRFLQQYVLHCTGYRSCSWKRQKRCGNFNCWDSSRILFLSSKKVQTHQTSFFVNQKIEWNCMEQRNSGLNWAPKRSTRRIKGWIPCKRNKKASFWVK